MFQCFLGQCTGSKFNTLKKLQKHTDTYHGNEQSRFNNDKDCLANEKWECTHPQCKYKADREDRVLTHYDRLHIRLKHFRESKEQEQLKRRNAQQIKTMRIEAKKKRLGDLKLTYQALKKKREDEINAWDVDRDEEEEEVDDSLVYVEQKIKDLTEDESLDPEIIAEGVGRMKIAEN